MEIEFDTGAALSLISSEPYHKITRASHMEPLVETNVHLQTHRVGRSLISYILVDGDGPSLMGSQPKSECLGDTSGVDEVLKGMGLKLNLMGIISPVQ